MSINMAFGKTGVSHLLASANLHRTHKNGDPFCLTECIVSLTNCRSMQSNMLKKWLSINLACQPNMSNLFTVDQHVFRTKWTSIKNHRSWWFLIDVHLVRNACWSTVNRLDMFGWQARLIEGHFFSMLDCIDRQLVRLTIHSVRLNGSPFLLQLLYKPHPQSIIV